MMKRICTIIAVAVLAAGCGKPADPAALRIAEGKLRRLEQNRNVITNRLARGGLSEQELEGIREALPDIEARIREVEREIEKMKD
jgi:TolA-binding protein